MSNSSPIEQPVTAIYSKSDAVVDWPATIDRFSPNVEHIEVDAAHLGLAFNRRVWDLVLQALHDRCGESGAEEPAPDSRFA